MVARNKPPRQRTSGDLATASRAIDAIALFSEKMRALHERDLALKEVVTLRDTGQIRKARAQLARAERLHAHIDAIDRQLAAGRNVGS